MNKIIEAMKEKHFYMLAALKSVAGEVSDGARPFSTESYLPHHIREQVLQAIKKAEAV